jgi:hypothetical protein
METENFIDRQNYMYSNHNYLCGKRWYRKLYGGKWYLIKFGKDTPYVWLFATWTKMNPKNFYGHVEILQTEKYIATEVDTKWKLFKEFFKQTLINLTNTVIKK